MFELEGERACLADDELFVAREDNRELRQKVDDQDTKINELSGQINDLQAENERLVDLMDRERRARESSEAVPTQAHVDAVHTLAEHYLGGKDIPERVMLDAWRELLPVSRVTVGNGWSNAEIEGSYEPMIHADDYSDDPEDCVACTKTNGPCERHSSLDNGVSLMARAVATMAAEPEVMAEVLHQADKFDAQATHDPTAPDHHVSRCLACQNVPAGTKIQVDAACPACQHPRQWFEPAKREFSCQRCDRRSLALLGDPRIEWGVAHPDVITVPIRSYHAALYTLENLPGSGDLVMRLAGEAEWVDYATGAEVTVHEK